MDNDKLVAAARAVVDHIQYIKSMYIRDDHGDISVGKHITSALFEYSNAVEAALPVQIKPCPAGHEAVYSPVYYDSHIHAIECDVDSCMWVMRANNITTSKDELIEHWNRRAGE